MDADAVRSFLIRYIEESELNEEITEQILRRILKILFGGEPDEKWMETAKALLEDRQTE